MKNKEIILRLSKFELDSNVSIKAYLESGCEESGNGKGVYNENGYSQQYSILWNEGYLCCGFSEGYTINDIIKVLKKRKLSEISGDDFNLRPGELMNGLDSNFETTWNEKEPEQVPNDRELYFRMSINSVSYVWESPSSIEFVIQNGKKGERHTIVLNDDY